jgi:hypothetical protein
VQRFYYDLIFLDKNLREENDLFAEDLASAIQFFDRLYLEVHQRTEEIPDSLVLRSYPSEEELLRYDIDRDLTMGA